MWGLPWMEWFHWEPANYLVFLGCCCHWEFWQNIVMTWHQWIAWEDKQKESRYGKTHTLIFFLLGCLLAFRPHKIRMKIWKHQVWRMDKCVVLGGNG
jgi:carbon starvation protein CstA